MEVVTLNCCWKSRPYNLSASVFQPLGMEFVGPRNSAEMSPARFFSGFRVGLRVFASRNSVKKSRKKEKSQKYDTSPSNKAVLEENDAVSNTPPLADNYIQENSNTSSFNHSEAQSTLLIPSRGAVLRACTITSCLIGTLGVVIRQVSHFASTKGWPVIDASSEISLNFETWHLELIVGLVILISSCRYLLLNIWLDFAESSEAANKQVLSSLEPSDYIVVAFLPGISESRNFCFVVHYCPFLAWTGRVSLRLLLYLGYCIWEVVGSILLLSGQCLSGLLTVMPQLCPQVSSCQWLLMQ
ncbi:uncharacterized protein [Coffea arabica]|uniref:Uncharacterized protein isoform X4 n=1 Tax=Coffea arabica TaxID=13443 RepID=A0A6P6V260_COFAR